MAAIVAEGLSVFTELGAHVEQVDPGFESPWNVFLKLWFAGAANLIRSFTAEQRALLDPGLAEIAAKGTSISLLDYLEALNQRGALGSRMSLFHEHYDFLLTPTLPIPAFTAGQEVPDVARGRRWFDWTPFSYPFNLTQQPAASIPCGVTKTGLPVGLQIVGPRYGDALVLRASRAFETVRPIRLPDLTNLDVSKNQ